MERRRRKEFSTELDVIIKNFFAIIKMNNIYIYIRSNIFHILLFYYLLKNLSKFFRLIDEKARRRNVE